MARLIPYIYGENVREQGEFYAKALNGEIANVLTFGQGPGADPSIADRVMHLVLKAGDLTLFMADSVKGAPVRGSGLDLTLEYKTEAEARRVFEALSDGGSVLMPFERMFWGTMFGRLSDRFGVRWQVVTEPDAAG
ncbi:glyoxalase [Gordoniibacillus kamchatkensis]|uniref:Glyoxalase n=1 Tax=Gordoniibacillus kamchatkensis TaxID=1590651 RepID=A0ABR5AL06_9BACL|nr:VOC family protein [Paenibacillus sp. VKM B-2647]KIL41200.1 glyoxalase [Paenibacillus sp. VKM B-2647]